VILRSSTLEELKTPFESLKVVLSQAIENIRDFGKADQVVSLELMVEYHKKDVTDFKTPGWMHYTKKQWWSSIMMYAL